jgi:hypothetical protein
MRLQTKYKHRLTKQTHRLTKQTQRQIQDKPKDIYKTNPKTDTRQTQIKRKNNKPATPKTMLLVTDTKTSASEALQLDQLCDVVEKPALS